MSVEDSQGAWAEATGHHAAGRFGEAEALYRKILDAEPRNSKAWDMLGVLEYQLGRWAAALERIDGAIEIDGAVAAYHGHRGMVLAALGDLAGAIAAYRRALELEPGRADALNNLGAALWALGDLAGAVATHREAARSGEPDAIANWGWALMNSGASEEAAAVLERAQASFPDDGKIAELLSVAWNNLGAAALQRGEAEAARAVCVRALEVRPEFFEARLNAGKALARLNRADEAISAFRRAIGIRPDNAEARNDLGNALFQRGRLEEAIESYGDALRLNAEDARTHNNLGAALRVRGRLMESVASYRRALRIAPEDAEIWNNLGGVLAALEDWDGAGEAFEKALALRPDLSEAHNNLGNVCKEQGDLDAALACYVAAVEARPTNQDAWSNRLYTLYFHPGYSLEDIYKEHSEWNARFAEGLRGEEREFGNDRSPGRRLRVGYVAPFFREHCQSFFTVPLLSNHDSESVEVFAYSDTAATDGVTARLKSYCDAWRDIAGLSDGAVAELVREDKIDVLVDLSLQMAGNRLLMFARKPAPVQVTWLGYPGGTGLTAMDYRLTDPYLDPVGSGEDGFYAEESFRLPHTFWCYDSLTSEPAPSDLPARRNGFVTFGCLNNFCKVNEGTLRLWAAALATTPGSRLLVLAPEGRARRRALETLERYGADGSRVEFTGRLPRARYLELYHRIDVGLDTFPYNGHTTSLDSLWMGVPVVTMAGSAPAGRAGWSQLSNLGLRELAAEGEADFGRTAARIAGDAAFLARLRTELRGRMRESPLCDGARFAGDMEAAFRRMWGAFCGEKP